MQTHAERAVADARARTAAVQSENDLLQDRIAQLEKAVSDLQLQALTTAVVLPPNNSAHSFRSPLANGTLQVR